MNELKLYPRVLTVGNPLPGCVLTTWPRNDMEPPDDLGGSIHATFLGQPLLSFSFSAQDWGAVEEYHQLVVLAREELFLRAYGQGTGRNWTRKDPNRKEKGCWEIIARGIVSLGLFRCPNCRRIIPTQDCPYCKEEEP